MSFTVNGIAWIDAQPPPPGGGPTYKIFAASGTAAGTVGDTDSRLANAANTTTPILAGAHTYSGNSWPSTFANTTMQEWYSYGFSSGILNVKCDWSDLAAGSYDTHLENFVDSIPDGFKLYLLINHEPENDSKSDGSGSWRDGQARMANKLATLDDDRCWLGVCLMGYTWDPTSGRNPEDWNPGNAPNITITPDALDRTVWAPDIYQVVSSPSPNAVIKTLSRNFDPCITDARSWGFSRFGLSESALDMGSSVTGDLSDSDFADELANVTFPYLDAIEGFEYYAYFNYDDAAATRTVMFTDDTPLANAVMGDKCEEMNR